MGREIIYKTIDEYIAQFPEDMKERLATLREIIRAAAPDATEKISWGMPTFYLKGNLIHFAGHKNHIGVYPGAEGVEAFRDRLGEYSFSKGAIQLPNNKPLPLDLISDIVRYRAQQNRA
jgi:uncharacterized protein YdhG (YjbR/CyaY superfamily)